MESNIYDNIRRRKKKNKALQDHHTCEMKNSSFQTYTLLPKQEFGTMEVSFITEILFKGKLKHEH